MDVSMRVGLLFFFWSAGARDVRDRSRQTSGTLEIDKHLELYKLKTKQKTKFPISLSGDGAIE